MAAGVLGATLKDPTADPALSWEKDCPVTEKSHKLHIKERGWSFQHCVPASLLGSMLH